MKFLITITLSLFSISAWSQNEIVYISSGPLEKFDAQIENYFFDEKNSESIINLLKKEIKRQQLGAFDKEDYKMISFGDDFSDFNEFNQNESEDQIMVMGVHQELVNSVDTSDNQLNGYFCENEFNTIINSEGEDSIMYNYESDSYYTVGNEIRNCSYYYSLDDITGIVFIEGFDDLELQELESINISEKSYYTNIRIGFVKKLHHGFNPEFGEYNETKECITFSTTIEALEAITGKSDIYKNYKKIRKFALKEIGKLDDSQKGYKGLNVFDLDEINEISNFFISDTSGTVKDPHFGITLFKY
jgi:hypothetical protein